MRTKKILALALTLALAFTLLSPMAHAASTWPTEDFQTSRAPLWLPTRLIHMVQVMRNTFIEGTRLNSLLIMHDGNLVFERYFNGYCADTPHYIASVTKAVVTALTGIAIADGYIVSIEQPVVDFFPEARDMPDWEASKADMTVEHLLRMQSGLDFTFEWDEFWQSENPGAMLFTLPQRSAPGAEFHYSWDTDVLAFLLERAIGRNLFEYAQETLFGPLGMDSVEWISTDAGFTMGGWGIDMTPRDMMRFGYLFLNYGYWDGQQIVPAEFVAAAQPGSEQYGFNFWRYSRLFRGSYEAAGMNGQKIIIIPGLDLIIVRTADVWPFIRDVGAFLWPLGR